MGAEPPVADAEPRPPSRGGVQSPPPRKKPGTTPCPQAPPPPPTPSPPTPTARSGSTAPSRPPSTPRSRSSITACSTATACSKGIRIYGGRILKLATHLRRLDESARAIRLNLPYSTEELTAACRETVEANGLTNGYIRLVATRGPGSLGIDPVPCPRPSVFIIAATIQLYPQSYYDEGLSVISSSVVRNHPQALSPRIKSLNYLNNILAKIEALDAGVLESVMYNLEGNVAEASADNLFIVRPDANTGDPVVWTPPLSAGCLEGVTRNLVIGLARDAGLRVREEDITRHDLYTCDEFFLTGSGAEVVPVVTIDRRPVGRRQARAGDEAADHGVSGVDAECAGRLSSPLPEAWQAMPYARRAWLAMPRVTHESGPCQPLPTTSPTPPPTSPAPAASSNKPPRTSSLRSSRSTSPAARASTCISSSKRSPPPRTT